jgi:hypothetical protein
MGGRNTWQDFLTAGFSSSVSYHCQKSLKGSPPVDNDQTELILQRKMHDNIKGYVANISHIQQNCLEAFLISQGAEEAFDSVSSIK